jgi:hypothetical protein
MWDQLALTNSSTQKKYDNWVSWESSKFIAAGPLNFFYITSYLKIVRLNAWQHQKSYSSTVKKNELHSTEISQKFALRQ